VSSTSVRNSEWSLGWPVVVGSFLGMFFSVGTMVIYMFGLFAPQWGKEFGWGRAEISLAVTVFAYTLVFAAPLYGYLIDKFGSRRIVIISTLLFAPAYALLYFVGPSKLQFYATFFLIGLAGAGTLPMGYTRLIIGWFDRNRGLALGLALVSAGVATTILPPIVQGVMDASGWRNAVLVLTAGILLVSLPGSYFLLKAAPGTEDKPATNNAPAVKVSFNKEFWTLVVFSVLSGIFLTGMLSHFVPILQDRGVEPSTAAWYASLVGISAIFGRISIGFLVDYIFAPRVVITFFVATIIGLLMLRAGSGDATYAFVAIVFGISLGAEMDVLSYMISRYFSPAQFGKVFGLMFSAFMLGSANGPLMLGILYDRFGDYSNALLIISIIASLAAISTLFLPRFKTDDELVPSEA